MGLLSCFVGMLTDSRSFLSFPRHDYFRRILCNLIGQDVQNGELPADSILNRDALTTMSFEPGGLVQSTLLSLISSGDLQLIDSDSIRMELTFLSGSLQEYEIQRNRITSDMLFPAFKELSATISPFDLYFYSISDDQYSAALVDSLTPLPERKNFKRLEEPNWKVLMSQKEFQDKLSFMYFSHVNLLRLHTIAHDNLSASKARLESLMISE